jgi:hypothetical protein
MPMSGAPSPTMPNATAPPWVRLTRYSRVGACELTLMAANAAPEIQNRTQTQWSDGSKLSGIGRDRRHNAFYRALRHQHPGTPVNRIVGGELFILLVVGVGGGNELWCHTSLAITRRIAECRVYSGHCAGFGVQA